MQAGFFINKKKEKNMFLNLRHIANIGSVLVSAVLVAFQVADLVSGKSNTVMIDDGRSDN